MNTPNDFMIEMGRLFGTGRGGQMNDLEAMQLEAQKNQLMEERARQEAVQKYVMGDENRLPGVQESQVGQNTVRAGQMANDQNARMNPIAVKQAQSNLAGTDINNQISAYARDYTTASNTVDGDPTGMAGVRSGAERQKISADAKHAADKEAASAAGSLLMGNIGGIAGLIKTPGQNGANVAKADAQQQTEATQMPGLENPGVPVTGIEAFTNGPGFEVMKQLAEFQQQATGNKQAAEANANRNKIQALEGAAQFGEFRTPGQQAAVDALGALGGVPSSPAVPAPNPLGDAARRVDAGRRGKQPGGGGGVRPGGAAALDGPNFTPWAGPQNSPYLQSVQQTAQMYPHVPQPTAMRLPGTDAARTPEPQLQTGPKSFNSAGQPQTASYGQPGSNLMQLVNESLGGGGRPLSDVYGSATVKPNAKVFNSAGQPQSRPVYEQPSLNVPDLLQLLLESSGGGAQQQLINFLGPK